MEKIKYSNYRAILMGKLVLCLLLVLCACGRPASQQPGNGHVGPPQVNQQATDVLQEMTPKAEAAGQKPGENQKPATIQPAKTTAAQAGAAAVPLTERQAMDKVIGGLHDYGTSVIRAEWSGHGEYAGYTLKTPDGELYLDSDGNQGGCYLLHLYAIIIYDKDKKLSNVATANWFEVNIDSGRIVAMYNKDGSINEEFANRRSGRAEDVDFIDTTYHNDSYRFTLTFPESWREKYVTIQSESVLKNNTCVNFYQRSSYDATEISMKMGRLFSVAVYTSQEWEKVKSDITSMTENLGVIKHESLVLYFAGPTDVQYDPDNKEAASEYKAMSRDIPGVVKTLSFDKEEALQSGNQTVEYVESEKIKNKALEKAIEKALEMDAAKAKQTRYYYNFVDLDDDGTPEVFVQMVGKFTSGTGGDLGLIFRNRGGSFEMLQEVHLIRNPIIISSEKTRGWHDLIVQVSGGGAKAHYVRMKFDGKQYPDTPDAEELADGIKISGKGIINNDIAEDFRNGKGLYLE